MATTINGSAGVTTNSGAVYDGLQRDTAKNATGTSVDFTGIPSWVKRITVMFDGVSTNGTSNLLIQLGDSGGIETTGYSSTGMSGAAAQTSTAGLVLSGSAATDSRHGNVIITNITGNTWSHFGALATSTTGSWYSGGSKTLSATLDRIRITTVNGTDTFDAGTINIIYE